MRYFQLSQPKDLWLMIIAASLWGTIGVAAEAIYTFDHTTSLFMSLARMLVATPILLLVCWRTIGRRMFSVKWRDGLIIMLGGSLLAISQAAYFAAIRSTGISIATLLTVCTAPLVVTLLAVLLKMETLTRRGIIALVCALIGGVLLVGLQPADSGQNDLLMGAFYSLVAAATYAGVILCGRWVANGYPPIQVTSFSFTSATVTLMLINLFSQSAPIRSIQGWLVLVYLGVVPSALAYGLFQMGLRTVSATAASIISMLEPLVAALLAWVLFGETLAPISMIGAALLIVSLALLSSEAKG